MPQKVFVSGCYDLLHSGHVKTFGLLEKIGMTTSTGAIICLYENLLPLNRKVQIVPVAICFLKD